MVATNIEVLSTPWSQAMYDWKDSKAVLLNGIFQTLSCLVSSGNSFLIGWTRIGQIQRFVAVVDTSRRWRNFGLGLAHTGVYRRQRKGGVVASSVMPLTTFAKTVEKS
ncbi:hypothetical protein OESDEN_08219 [Oesophagostomum dentatum]|uniref:Uncharacterized protein n=1 Tax=Oesophagostomum dentatum TaxID=61180 RepID=A0A0B1T939_OESDE|nr:hypothetical protein OESDEN_08219 [Oesophagostomum dentatum]